MDKKIDIYLLLTTYDLRILRWRKKYKKVHTGCQKIPGKSNALTNSCKSATITSCTVYQKPKSDRKEEKVYGKSSCYI